MAGAGAPSGGGGDLGRVSAVVEYVYDPTGAQEFIAASGQIIQAANQVAQGLQQQGQAIQNAQQALAGQGQQGGLGQQVQLVNQFGQAIQSAGQQAQQGGQAAAQGLNQQTQATQAATGATQDLSRLQTQLEATQLRARIAATDHAGRIRILTQELSRLQAATQEAGLAQDELLRRQVRASQVEAQLAQETRALADQQQRSQQQEFGGATRGALQGFGVGGAVLGGLGAAGVFAIATREVIDFAKAASDAAMAADAIGRSFQASSQQARVSSSELLAAMRTAARGTVSDTDLMLDANKAFALGVGQNTRDIADLLAIARQRGKEFGTDTSTAFDQIVTGLGRISPRILDNLGIIIDEQKVYEDWAKSIGRSADSLTEQEKRQALVNDVIRTNTDLVKNNADATITAEDKVAEARARRQNAEVTIGEKIEGPRATFEENLATILQVITGTTPPNPGVAFNQGLISQSTSYEDYLKRLQDTRNQISAQISPAATQGHPTEQDNQLEELWIGLLHESTKAEYDNAKAIQSRIEAVKATKGPFDDAIDQLNRQRKSESDLERTERDLQQARTTADRSLSDAARENFTKNREQLVKDVQDAGQKAADEQDKVNKQLEKLESSHQDKMDEIRQRGADEAARAQKEIDDAVAEGQYKRHQLEVDNQQRIDDLQNRFDEENKRASDDLTKRLGQENDDLAKSQGRAWDDLHRQQARAQAEFDKQEARAAKKQAEDLALIREEAQTNELRSREQFTEQLFGLTRRASTRQQREQALQQQQAAITEANALAATDPQAAAQLLQERQRQILEGIQVQEQQRQLRRDAARGGDFGRQDAEQEIALENQGRKAANDAAIKLIYDQASAQKKQRDDDSKQRKDDFAAQLEQQRQDLKDRQNLENQDLKERQDREKKEAKDAADRRKADFDREMDQTKINNKQRLDEFDHEQANRIQQMKDHATEQQAQVTAQLKAEEKSYTDSQKNITDDYGKFLKDLKGKVQDDVNRLNWTPDQIAQQKTTDALGQIGDVWGQAWAQHITDALKTGVTAGIADLVGQVPKDVQGNPIPGTVKGQTGNPLTDPVLDIRAERLLTPNARPTPRGPGEQGGTFNSARNIHGVEEVHGGVDIPANEGDPIFWPFDEPGTVAIIGSSPDFGNNIQIDDAAGNRWYFGHIQKAAASMAPGRRVTSGDVVAYVGHTGAQGIGSHIHVQEKPHHGLSAPVDPTGTLNALVGAAGANRTGASRYGGAQNAGPVFDKVPVTIDQVVPVTITNWQAQAAQNPQGTYRAQSYTTQPIGPPVRLDTPTATIPAVASPAAPGPTIMPVQVIGSVHAILDVPEPARLGWGSTFDPIPQGPTTFPPITVHVDGSNPNLDVELVRSNSRIGVMEGLAAFVGTLRDENTQLANRGNLSPR